MNKNKEWLKNELEWLPKNKSNNGGGRPLTDFQKLSERTKKDRTAALRNDASSVGPASNVLASAAATALYVEGKRAAAELVLQATQFSPMRPVRMRKMIKTDLTISQPVPYTPEQALALFIECGLNKDSYNILRKGAKTRNADIYPSYQKLTEAKKRLIEINESGKI